MRAVVVILERQLLQMLKQVFSDIVDDILADIHHDTASDRRENDTDDVDADEHSDQRKQKFLVFVRNRKVQCPLDNHRRNVAERAADAA